MDKANKRKTNKCATPRRDNPSGRIISTVDTQYIRMDMQALKDEARAMQTRLIKTRRYLHAHAETGFDLPATKQYVIQALRALGYAPKELGRAGVVADVGKGRTAFLLRADMDGLPITEKTGLSFACKTGAMHACGHDMHTTMLLGCAELLKNHESELPCKVRLLFQPAEELLEGAKDCIKNGGLENVSCAMMLHVLTGLPMPAGTWVIAEDVSAPSADYFTINVKGKACHGGTPQNGVDALSIGARIVLGMEEIVAKETPSSTRAVLTVGKMQGGVAGNAIAERVEMQGTLRCFGEDTRAFIKRRIKETAQGIAKTFRGKATFSLQGGCPSLINDRGRVEFTKKALGQVFDENTVLLSSKMQGTRERSGGSEDFAYIAHEVPSVMIGLCAGEESKGYTQPLHHASVNFDEEVLWQGALAFAVCALTN